MTTGTLQHRRADSATLLAATPADGEIFVDTDNYKPLVGDGISAGGILTDGARVNAQVGTTYAILNSDVGRLVTFSNGSSVAVSMAQAGSGSGAYFKAQSKVQVLNLGMGLVTITPTTSTINGLSSIALSQYEGAIIYSDGADYLALVFKASIPITLTATKTSNYGVSYSDRFINFNNIGAGGDIILTLPAAADGVTFGFVVYAAHYIKIQTDGTDTISIGTYTSSAGGYVQSNTLHSYITLTAASGGIWTTTAVDGSWSIDGGNPYVTPLPLGTSQYDQLVWSGSAWQPQRARYIIGSSTSGIMSASQNLLFHRFSKAVTIPANFGSYLGHNSEAGGSANATGSTVIDVAKAANATPTTFSAAGTITIGAGGVTPTFASSGGVAITFAQGDVLRLQGPASPDVTFADFYATLVGFET